MYRRGPTARSESVNCLPRPVTADKVYVLPAVVTRKIEIRRSSYCKSD